MANVGLRPLYTTYVSYNNLKLISIHNQEMFNSLTGFRTANKQKDRNESHWIDPTIGYHPAQTLQAQFMMFFYLESSRNALFHMLLLYKIINKIKNLSSSINKTFGPFPWTYNLASTNLGWTRDVTQWVFSVNGTNRLEIQKET